DPPYHTRVRRAIQTALVTRVINGMRPALVSLVDSLLDNVEEQGDFDLIGDFAAAIPVEVIGNLLSIPREERDPLRDWSLAILGALEPNISDDVRDRANAAVSEFSHYLSGVIEIRRRHLQLDGADALSLMIAADDDGASLTNEELIHNAIFLLNAGHETTTNLIGNGVAALLATPSEWRRLYADPELINSAVEEFLRFESSNQLGNRLVTAPTQIGDVTLEPGTGITLGIGAANRDPTVFPDPERLDITRTPNRHLAFGLGAHACAGMNLARLEGQVAIGRLVQRFPSLLQTGDAVRGQRARFRGFLRFPVRV
ncbi:MAG: cytochrome P450, partial [Pseudomonadota bacterium]